MKNRLTSFLRASLLACALASAASAQITVNASADTQLVNHGDIINSATTNYSSATFMQSLNPANSDYQSYPLFKFDLSGYAGATVTGNATLSLFVTAGSAGLEGTSRTAQLRALAGPVDFSTVTWVSYDAAYGLTGSPYDPADPSSYGAAIGGAQTFTPVVGAYSTFVIPAATVQSWIDSPSTNHGFVFFRAGLDYTNYSVNFSSLEGADVPTLSFETAAAIPEPSTYAAIAGAMTLGLAVWNRRRKNAATAPAAAA